MSRLILDHFRRWWWVLAIAGAFQFLIGWSIARRPEEAFEFWVLLVALWTGATRLSFDLKHGLARTVMALPLTAKQIGRSWWVATIPIPAMLLTALLFLGAGTFHYFHPDKVFPAGRLALASLFVLPWLGTAFTPICGMNDETIFGSWRERINSKERTYAIYSKERTYDIFFSLLAMAMLFGGMWTLQDSTKQPVKFSIYLGVGALLIVAGWIRAERSVKGHVKFSLPALRRKIPSSQYRVPAGYGGIPFLLISTCVRVFIYIAATVALMAVLMMWQGQAIPRGVAIATFAATSSFMACGFVMVFQLLPALRQLRSLRTLPISSTRLAVVMIAMVVLPLIAVGVLVTGVAGLALGTQVAMTFLKSYTLFLAPAALGVFFAVWRGDGVSACILLGVTLVGFILGTSGVQGFFHYPELPLSLIGPIVVTCVLLAFLLTRRTLMHGSRAYRNSSTMTPGWGGWR